MNEEKRRILKMVEEGKISADEAAQLMEALESTAEEPVTRAAGQTAEGEEASRVLKIRVFNKGSEEPKVNLNIPLRFIGFLKNMIPQSEKEKIERRGFDLDELMDRAEHGSIGTIMDIEDDEDSERVLITIE
jgi:hypothetical protein